MSNTVTKHPTGNDGRGYYIRTFTGRKFYWEDIESNVIDIHDIAHALSMNCRWTGHVREFYSVAQHSLYASYEVPPEHALSALLHDAAEAYVHDTPSPLKWYLEEHGFSVFADLDRRIDAHIFKTFNISYPRDPVVKVADLRMLATEHRDLMPVGQEHSHMLEPYPWKIRSMFPREAERAFLHRFNELTWRK